MIHTWKVIGLGSMLCLGLTTMACTPEVESSADESDTTRKQCTGKCDDISDVGALPLLSVQTDLKTGTCIWTGKTDDQMTLACAMTTLVEKSTLQHVQSYVNVSGDFIFAIPGTDFRDEALDGEFREVATISRQEFDRGDVQVQVNVILGGANGNSLGVFYYIDTPVPEFLAEGDRQEFELPTPFELRPISFWPSPEIVTFAESFDYLNLFMLTASTRLDLTELEGFRTDPSFGSRTVKVFQDDGLLDPRKIAGKVFYMPVVPGANSPINVSVMLDTGEQPKYDLTEPGYYVVNIDKTLTLTAPSDLPDIGPLPHLSQGQDMSEDMSNSDDMGSVDDMSGSTDMHVSNDMENIQDMASDTTPDMTPVDPCMAQCSSSQVCVAGSCVERSTQMQSYCTQVATKSCDMGEDGDCAEGNVCVAGMCHRRSCQTQEYCSTPARRSCDANEDSDCAEGNVCVEGLCHRRSCQTQSYCSGVASKTCDMGEDGDCAEGNVCVEGLCRKLSCQSQEYCNTPAWRPCEQDTHCVEGNSCMDNVCAHDSCM